MSVDKNSPEQADVEQRQATLAFQRGDLAGAEAHFQAALEINQALGDPAVEARCWHRLGSTAMAGGDLDTAARHFETALGIREEIRDGAGQRLCRHDSGRSSSIQIARRHKCARRAPGYAFTARKGH